MRISDNWKDYELLDCTDGEKLERWGDVILIRPDPQVIWKTGRQHPLWKRANARYNRSQSGGGSWQVFGKLPERWEISCGDLTFNIKTMGFKHTGLFPEQATNWALVRELIQNENREIRVLNLFAYTGGATVAALKAGAAVTHVDASRGMTQWARENAASSGVAGGKVRWLVDDCIKFVQREIRRGSRYDVIIMDPPSYGRGPGGEVWKLENEVFEFVVLCEQLLSDNALAMLINSYTTGLSPSVMEYILGSVIVPGHGGKVSGDELGLRVTQTGLALPCGATAIWKKQEQENGKNH